LIAEEVADVFPEVAVRGADGQVEGRLEALEQRLNELLRERKAGR
jgi:hypothetical protein